MMKIDSGCFYQHYTTAIDGKFFIEIVQRDNHYTGLGAANAWLRASAQHHSMITTHD